MWLYCFLVSYHMTCWFPDTNMLIPDAWYLALIFDMLLLDIWHLTIDMLSLDTWHMLSLGTNTLELMLWRLIGYYYTWYLYYIVYSWLSLLRGLDTIIILISDIWYSWTPVLLNSCISCTHVPRTVTLVNSMFIPASDGACRLVSGWRGCIPRLC